MSATLDSQLFRQALGQFATGITVVSTTTDDGRQIGLTANSFNSVSLDPPLVLWSLTRKSSNFDAFQTGRFFGVSVLGSQQEALANHFATFKGDRFADVALSPAIACNVPLIEGAVAHFECKTRSIYNEGDHIIIVGEVLHCATNPGPALVYHAKTFQSTR